MTGAVTEVRPRRTRPDNPSPYSDKTVLFREGLARTAGIPFSVETMSETACDRSFVRVKGAPQLPYLSRTGAVLTGAAVLAAMVLIGALIILL